jgi:hypothetical protein
MIQNTKDIISFSIAVLLSILILFTVYSVVDKRVDTVLTPEKAEEQFRDIETPAKKWLNGYLGMFFRFKYLGNIHWLLIPFLVYFLARVKERQRWQTALIFAWLLTVLFIAIKGYTNFRYQFSLVPFTAGMVLLLLWELLKDKEKGLKILCFSFLGLVCVYNIYHYFDHYKFYWDIKISRERAHFPYQLIDYLNSAKDLEGGAKRVFVIDQPLFYYYTDRRGIDMQAPRASFWISNDLKKKRVSRERIFGRLKRRRADYILAGAAHKNLYRSLMLTEFLLCECRLVVEDHGWFLYRLRDKPLERELQSPRFERFFLWRHRKKRPRNASPWLKTFRAKGTFAFDYSRDRDSNKNKLTIHSVEPDETGVRQINFGYELKRKDLEMEIPEGKYIHFIVKALVSPTLIDRDNFVFISDYNDKDKNWKSERIYFFSPYWRTCMVSKKIRRGSHRVIMGIRFTPKSPEDKLEIENARIYVSEEPL